MDWDTERAKIERIITQDRSSGMIHLRLKVNGNLYTQEGCNLDQAGEYDILTDLPEQVDLNRFCATDFPQMHDPAR